MGQAVKYAMLAAAVVAIIALIVVYLAEVPISSTAGQLASSTTSFVNACSSYLQSARGLLNALFGSSELVTFLLWYVLLMPFAKFALHVTVAVFHFINK